MFPKNVSMSMCEDARMCVCLMFRPDICRIYFVKNPIDFDDDMLEIVVFS